MTTPRTTEDGETCPNDISGRKPRTTSPVQPATRALLQTGTDVGEPKSAQLVVWKVTIQEDAGPDKTMNCGVPGVTKTITAIILADYPPDAPAHPGTQMITIHIHPHMPLTTTQCHQWNQTTVTGHPLHLCPIPHRTRTYPC